MALGRPKAKHITYRQAAVLQEIIRYKMVFNRYPTMREIAVRYSITPPSVHELIGTLVAKGYLEKMSDPSERRFPYRVVREVKAEWLAVQMIPVLNFVPNVLSEEVFKSNRCGMLEVDVSLTRGSALFGLRIDRHNIDQSGMEPGDIIVVRCQQVAADGDVIVAWWNRRPVLRKLFYNPDFIALSGLRRDDSIIKVRYSDDFRIIGKIISCNQKGDS